MTKDLLFRKRKHTSSDASDGEDNHPPAKREELSTDASPPGSVKFSPAGLEPETSRHEEDEQHRHQTVGGRFMGAVRKLIRKDCRPTAEEVNDEVNDEVNGEINDEVKDEVEDEAEEEDQHYAYVMSKNMEVPAVSTNMRRMVRSCANEHVDKARQAGRPMHDPQEMIWIVLNWMAKLTHQRQYLETKSYIDGSGDFRETLDWAEYHVELAEDELNRGPPPGDRKLGKRKAVHDMTYGQSSPGQETRQPNEAASGQQTSATNRSPTRGVNARAMSNDRPRELQRSLAIGGFSNQRTPSTPEDQETPSTPNDQDTPSTLNTQETPPTSDSQGILLTPNNQEAPPISLPSCRELRASVEARKKSTRAAARERMGSRGSPPPVPQHAYMSTSSSTYSSSTSPLATPPLGLMPPPARPFPSPRHHGPSDYHPPGPANTFPQAVQQRQRVPPPFPPLKPRGRRDAIYELPPGALPPSQHEPIQSVERDALLPGVHTLLSRDAAYTPAMYSAPAPAPAPSAPSVRVARYREAILPVIEAHVRGGMELGHQQSF